MNKISSGFPRPLIMGIICSVSFFNFCLAQSDMAKQSSPAKHFIERLSMFPDSREKVYAQRYLDTDRPYRSDGIRDLIEELNDSQISYILFESGSLDGYSYKELYIQKGNLENYIVTPENSDFKLSELDEGGWNLLSGSLKSAYSLNVVGGLQVAEAYAATYVTTSEKHEMRYDVFFQPYSSIGINVDYVDGLGSVEKRQFAKALHLSSFLLFREKTNASSSDSFKSIYIDGYQQAILSVLADRYDNDWEKALETILGKKPLPQN